MKGSADPGECRLDALIGVSTVLFGLFREIFEKSVTEIEISSDSREIERQPPISREAEAFSL
jgi:hypothetical protein